MTLITIENCGSNKLANLTNLALIFYNYNSTSVDIHKQIIFSNGGAIKQVRYKRC